MKFFALLMMLSLPLLCFAQTQNLPLKLYNDDITVYPGWNLVPVFSSEDSTQENVIAILDNNSLHRSEIIGTYQYWGEPVNKYVGHSGYSNGNYVNLQLTAEDGQKLSERASVWRNESDGGLGYTRNLAAWIYVNNEKQMHIRENTYDTMIPITMKKFWKGWNLVTITDDLWNADFGRLGGNCNIQMLAAFDAQAQQWKVAVRNGTLMSGTTLKDALAPNSFVGYGAALKVSDDCKLTGVDMTNPPPMPS